MTDYLAQHVGLLWLLSVPALLIALSIYFAPTIVAFSRSKANRVPIAVLNLVLGWTVLGWVGALVWASYDRITTEPFPWNRALKFSFVFASVFFVLCAGVYGYYRYDIWKADKKHKADVEACKKSLALDALIFPTDDPGKAVDSFCEENPGTNIACGIKETSYGYHIAYSVGDTDASASGKICTSQGWKDDPNYKPALTASDVEEAAMDYKPKKQGVHAKVPDQWALVISKYGIGATLVKRCAFDASTAYGCMFGEERIAELKDNDCVVVLSGLVRMANGKEAYQVRFRHWTGWVESENLNLLAGGCPE